MIRPWYRSRLFWLGLPGLVFLLWLWLAKADQIIYLGHTRITRAGAPTTRWIGAGAGSIYQITYSNHFDPSLKRGFHWGLDPDGPLTYIPLRPFGIYHKTVDPGEYRETRLAWWVVISAYTAVWLGTVAGWQRRKARLSRRAAAAEVPGS